MQTEQRNESAPEQAASSPIQNSFASVNSEQHNTKNYMTTPMDRPLVPAKMPLHSRAAAAQRLNDLPEKPARGVYYEVPHRRPYPTGWRTKRHIKRKLLNQE